MIEKGKLDDVLQYITRYTEENGFPPTVRDICADLKIKSTATAYSYVNRLTEMGLLNKAEKKKRAVTLNIGDTVKIPLLGTVTAGQPIFAVENFESYYALPSSDFKGDQLFMLRVRGESMILAGIYDRDKIIVRKQETAENGDIVVAMFDDGIEEGATVKRFYRKNGKIILHPENDALSDYVLDNVTILGKVIGLLRSMS